MPDWRLRQVVHHLQHPQSSHPNTHRGAAVLLLWAKLWAVIRQCHQLQESHEDTHRWANILWCGTRDESLVSLRLMSLVFCFSRRETVCVHSAWLWEALHRILQPLQTPCGPHTLQTLQLQPLWENLQADLNARYSQTHSPQRHGAHRGGAGGLLRTPNRLVAVKIPTACVAHEWHWVELCEMLATNIFGSHLRRHRRPQRQLLCSGGGGRGLRLRAGPCGELRPGRSAARRLGNTGGWDPTAGRW